MDLDDSKYLLQLARAAGVKLPPGPGDWSVLVKPPSSDGTVPPKDQLMYFMGAFAGDNQPPSSSPGHSPEHMQRHQIPSSPSTPASMPDPGVLRQPTGYFPPGAHDVRAAQAHRGHARTTSQDMVPAHARLRQLSGPSQSDGRPRRQTMSSDGQGVRRDARGQNGYGMDSPAPYRDDRATRQGMGGDYGGLGEWDWCYQMDGRSPLDTGNR